MAEVMAAGLEGLGTLRQPVLDVLHRMTEERWAERIQGKDGSLWSDDRRQAEEIAGWMGWLSVARDLLDKLDVFARAREAVATDRYDHAVLCGMGGSSLCPDVLRRTFGRQPGAPELLVLDSTHPSAIAAVERTIRLDRTLFIIASKSGGTTETLSHYKYFHQRMREAQVPHDSRQFVAITDEGSGLHKLAGENDFAISFLNPKDIGGRYSALSYFGMMPAAIMGLDVQVLLQGGERMRVACEEPEAAANPGLLLGAVLGTAAVDGRDKATIVCSPKVASFGTWLEQLLAESTGKLGTGIVPVESEPLGGPGDYGHDRLFVHVAVRGDGGADADRLQRQQAAGQPVFTIEIESPEELGAEFMRWEIATAAAGAILRINPFDQPNVQESKDNTRAALTRRQETGDFGVDAGDGGVEHLRPLLDRVRAGDYFATLAYTHADEEVDGLLGELRVAVRDRRRVATTTGYGPRYLHSTGQLHKGGPETGVYLILTDEAGDELPIPGEAYGFKTLIRAQWAGDLKSLRDHGRRVERVDLGRDRVATLGRLLELARKEEA
jgi:transaldolase/glucose-6-phosphate isomerase